MKKILTGLCLAILLGGCSKFAAGLFMDYEADLQRIGMALDPNEPQGDRFDEIVENPFVKVSDEPKSTFSVDADGAAYAYFRRMVNMGRDVPVEAVRIEEFLNYFTFDYADPTGGETLALNAETGPCPWNPDHRLLRLGLKGKTLSARETPLANFVFLIDVSGSMDSDDKLPILKSGLLSMLDQMDPEDQVSIVTYSGKSETLLKPTKVRQSDKIAKAIRKLKAEGCTNGGDALRDAYKLAKESFIQGGNNRIIMGTDGDFNVGVTSTDDLLEIVENGAKDGIYMTVCGFGTGNLNDAMMETISNHGNGTYEYIDSEDEMMKVFVHERNRFVAVANDTKVQLTFDPATVDSYRLIGYENRVMANEDFEDDDKDAGEIGSGQTITALYEIIPTETASTGLRCCTFDVRYKNALKEASKALTLDVKYGVNTLSENLSFAAGLAALGLTLRNSEYKGTASVAMSRELVENALAFDPNGYRAQLLNLFALGITLPEEE
jgi:Ca-activated chloride channel family protein